MDELGLLRAGGTSDSGNVSAAEAGYTSTVRDAGTGRAVLDIRKTPQRGLPVVAIVVATKVTGTFDRAFQLTIEASDAEAFNNGYETVATFPIISTFGEHFHVRRVHTQKRYLRTVIARTTTGSAGKINYLVFVGHSLMNAG